MQSHAERLHGRLVHVDHVVQASYSIQAVYMEAVLAARQVRGVEAIKAFSQNLIHPYVPAPKAPLGSRTAELEAEVARLKARCSELEQQLGAAQNGAK